MIIRFRLDKYEKALVFQVLDMREDLRGRDAYLASNGVEIKTTTHPYLEVYDSTPHVYVRGCDSTQDAYPAGIAFSSNEKRDEYYENVIQALKEWAEHHSKQGTYPLSNGEFVF